MSWMEDHVETDIQTAIQSQAIQTALERQTTATTDAGFQSFLQSAPIPRAYFLESASNTTLTTGVEATITFGQASRIHDPYAMLSSTANTFRIPMDGFYSMVFGVRFTVPAGSGSASSYAGFKTSAVAGYYAANTYLGLQMFNNVIQVGVTQIQFSVPLIKPFRQGDTFKCVANQTSGVNEDTIAFDSSSPYLSIIWCAPFNQYTAGSGGN